MSKLTSHPAIKRSQALAEKFDKKLKKLGQAQPTPVDFAPPGATTTPGLKYNVEKLMPKKDVVKTPDEAKQMLDSVFAPALSVFSQAVSDPGAVLENLANGIDAAMVDKAAQTADVKAHLMSKLNELRALNVFNINEAAYMKMLVSASRTLSSMPEFKGLTAEPAAAPKQQAPSAPGAAPAAKSSPMQEVRLAQGVTDAIAKEMQNPNLAPKARERRLNQLAAYRLVPMADLWAKAHENPAGNEKLIDALRALFRSVESSFSDADKEVLFRNEKVRNVLGSFRSVSTASKLSNKLIALANKFDKKYK